MDWASGKHRKRVTTEMESGNGNGRGLALKLQPNTLKDLRLTCVFRLTCQYWTPWRCVGIMGTLGELLGTLAKEFRVLGLVSSARPRPSSVPAFHFCRSRKCVFTCPVHVWESVLLNPCWESVLTANHFVGFEANPSFENRNNATTECIL